MAIMKYFCHFTLKFAKNKNAQLQKICSFKKKTNRIFEFSTTKLGKNKCRYQCNKNCVPQCYYYKDPPQSLQLSPKPFMLNKVDGMQ